MVTVTHPDGVTIETLNWWEEFNLTYAGSTKGLYYLTYPTSSVANGEYEFTINDGSNIATYTEFFTSNQLHEVPTLNAPNYFVDDDGDDAIEFSWSSVPGAVSYQVRIAIRTGTNFGEIRPVYTYMILNGDTSAVIPKDFLAPGCDYLYYVMAYREDPRDGFYALNNASRSQDYNFRTHGTAYGSTLSWFGVRHRTHEGDNWRSDYNQVIFILESELGISSPQDILKTVKLFDPNNNPVSFSGVGYWNRDYRWRKGVYNGNEDVWNYDDTYKHDTYYSGIVYDNLIDGTYRLELIDAYGKELSREATFTSLPQPLPIISSDTFECHPDIWNNIHCSWEIPEGAVYPEGAYFRSRVDGGFGKEGPNGTWLEYWLEIQMNGPTSLNTSFVPSHVAETLFAIDDPPLEYLGCAVSTRTANSDHRARTRPKSLGDVESFFHVDNGGGGPIHEEDKDSDGIDNKVDVSGGIRINETYSNDFSDGTTTGTISNRGSLIFDIKDVNYPEGVSIATTGSGAGEVEACDGSTKIPLTPGDDIVVTCGSAIVKVLNGEVVAEFYKDEVLIATVTLIGEATSDTENTITFDPGTSVEPPTFSVPETNTLPVEIVVTQGIEVNVEYSISIDIMPASDDSCIDNNGNGVIPVTIFSNPSIDFDATQVNPASVTLEGMAIKMVGKANKYLSHVEDINGDGYNDLVVQVQDMDGMLSPGTSEVTLVGELNNGTLITASEIICVK